MTVTSASMLVIDEGNISIAHYSVPRNRNSNNPLQFHMVIAGIQNSRFVGILKNEAGYSLSDSK